MSTWLTAWRNRERHESTPPIMELLVVAGADAGSQFTLEGDEILVGRGQPESGQTDVVRLRDKSISRRQVWIRRDGSGTTIEHIDQASNPTFVNGVAVECVRLREGDRIEMGRVAIDVRARGGMNLSGLTEIMEDAARDSTLPGVSLAAASTTPSPRDESTIGGETARPGMTREVTDIREVDVQLGEITVLRGAEAAVAASFPIPMEGVRIGRGDDVEVQIIERGVSRVHAEIRMQGRSLVLLHRSETNTTLVNGLPVLDRVELRDGDELQLADRVVLGLRIALADARAAGASSGSGLSRTMEHKIDLEREIEEFSVMGSFLDVDVVASRTMKGGGEKAERIIVSFDRFRAYVGGICEEFEGQVLNSNGDELMCFFESARSAVLAGSAILDRLAGFNRDQNLLDRDFRFRLGVHTGLSLVDLDAGVAYSEVLDTAGHIQKQADPDTLLVSDVTRDALPDTFVLRPVGEMSDRTCQLFRVERAAAVQA